MAEKVPRRFSVSFPEEQYDALHRLADQKRVSVSWVIRDAVRIYVEGDLEPLTEAPGETADHVRPR